MPPTLEAELRFRAETDEPLDGLALAPVLGAAALGTATTADETDHYLDTPDRRLAAARWACRLRTRAGRTIVSLKGPSEHIHGDPLHRRPELEGPAGPGLDPRTWAPSPAREFLSRLLGGAALDVRVTLEQGRTERTVIVEGRTVGLLSLDRVRVLQQGTDVGFMRVVELELEASALRRGFDPTPLTATLVEWPGLLADPQSKYERALAMTEAAGP